MNHLKQLSTLSIVNYMIIIVLAKDQYIQNILDDFSGQVKEALNMTTMVKRLV